MSNIALNRIAAAISAAAASWAVTTHAAGANLAVSFPTPPPRPSGWAGS